MIKKSQNEGGPFEKMGYCIVHVSLSKKQIRENTGLTQHAFLVDSLGDLYVSRNFGVAMFFDPKKATQPKKKSPFWGAHFSDEAPKLTKRPFRSKKWAPRNSLLVFGGGQRTTASGKNFTCLRHRRLSSLFCSSRDSIGMSGTMTFTADEIAAAPLSGSCIRKHTTQCRSSRRSVHCISCPTEQGSRTVHSHVSDTNRVAGNL